MRFHLGDILSVTTGCLVSPDHVGGVYNLLNHMTGDNLFTHQLPRASDECRPALLAQHPDLADVVAPDFADEAHVWRWLAEQVDLLGETREVEPLKPGDHTVIDPIAELRMIRSDMPIVVVEL
jgi:hypothetical protein